jgi:hypothetical protein
MHNDSLFVVIVMVMFPVPVSAVLVPATPLPVFPVVPIRCRSRGIDDWGRLIDYGRRFVDYRRGCDIHGSGTPEIHPDVHVRKRGTGRASR